VDERLFAWRIDLTLTNPHPLIKADFKAGRRSICEIRNNRDSVAFTVLIVPSFPLSP
jgi:hypothetical protein